MARKKKKRSYGSGCVLTKGSGFAIRWREPVLMPDGSIQKVLRFEALGSVSKKEANQALRHRLSACQTPRRAPMTFSELGSVWQKTVLPMYKYSTRKHHGHILKAKLLPIFGDRRVDKITRQEVQQYVAQLISRGYAPKSIDHYHDVLSTILTKAVEWGYIQNNPAHGVELPRIAPICEKWTFTPVQAQELLSQLAPLPRTIIGLALLTGARRGELFALRWRSFDREKRALLIEEAIYDGIIDKPKTEKSIRRIPLSNAAFELLESWSKALGVTSPDSFIFAKRNGIPKDPKQIMRDHVFPACEALGLQRPGWLTFRRTFATWADQNGVSAKQRGDLMGNSAEVNAEAYTQVTDSGCAAQSSQWVNNFSHRRKANCSPIVHFSPDGRIERIWNPLLRLNLGNRGERI